MGRGVITLNKYILNSKSMVLNYRFTIWLSVCRAILKSVTIFKDRFEKMKIAIIFDFFRGKIGANIIIMVIVCVFKTLPISMKDIFDLKFSIKA